jgi:hypothetical protein
MGLLLLLGNQRVIEYWVDPVSGSNSNAGTKAAPFATIRYAFDRTLKATDQVVVNVVPSGNLQSGDNLRLLPQHNGASLVLRSATPGSNFTITDADIFIRVFANTTSKIRIQDASVTCNKIIYFDGSNLSGRAMQITIAGNCVFTHARSNAEEAMRLIVPPAPNGMGLLRTESGCQVNGWSAPFHFLAGAIGEMDINGMVCDGTSTFGGVSYLSGSVVRLRNCTIDIPTTGVVNQIQFISENAIEVTVTGNEITINSTSSPAISVQAPPAGKSTTAVLTFSDNQITGDTGTPLVQLGRDFIDSYTRAEADALVEQFLSVECADNDLVQENLDGGVLRLFIGCDGATCTGNYFRTAQLGDTTNVHQVYLWADGIQFENNVCQSSVLAFGPNQVIQNNIIVADRCILLGGTQGGAQNIGGGNNYTVRDNVLISFDDDCYSDYAFNGAYPTNLGTLVADIDANYYVTLSGAAGLARLTAAGLTATTITQLRNLWQQSVLSGSGSGVWGDASNSDNDLASSHVTAGAGYDSAVSLCVQSAELSRSQLASLDTALRA